MPSEGTKDMSPHETPDEHGEGCDCAPCETLVMGPFDGWQPRRLPDGTNGTCTFCRKYGTLDHYTPLGMPVGRCCATAE